MRRLVRLGMICAFVCALSLGLFAACGGNEPKVPEKLKITYDLDLSGKDVTYSTTLDATLNDENAILAITVTKPNGEQETVNAGDTFSFDAAGFYTVTYTATRGEESATESVTNYVGLQGEAISFETATSGAGFAAGTDWNAEHEINTVADFVKYGKQSLKGTFTDEGINGQNRITVAFSNAISVGTANHATLWIYASEACELGIEAQEGTNWTWLGETKKTLAEGWNEVFYDFNKEITDSVSGFKFVNYGANTPTLYFDTFCFAREWQIYANTSADTILDVGGTVALSDFYTLILGEDVDVTATAEKGTVNGLQYTAPDQGGQIDTVLITAKKDSVEKTLSLTLTTKGAAKIAAWNMGVTDGFTLGAWKAVAGTDNMEVVDNDAAEGSKTVKITVAQRGGVSFTCGTHAANGATHVRLRIYAEKACALTLSVQENGGDWVQILGADGAELNLNAGWNNVTLQFTKAAEYPFNNFVFKPTSAATGTTIIELDTVTFLKGESLLTSVDAESSAEINEVFKPVVTAQDGSVYTLEIVTCPADSIKPIVTDKGFTPNALGEYSYKIIVSKAGYESEEYAYSVTVVDTIQPVITGTPATVPTKFVGESITFADMLTGLTVTDNFDTGLTLSFKEMKKGDSVVSKDDGATGYTFTQSGNYTVIFAVKDSSHNEATVAIPVKVEGGIDFGDVDSVEIFVGDELIVPEYTIPDTAGLTVTFYLDNREITVGSDRNAGVQNTVGNYTLKAELKKADGTQIAEQTLTVKIKDITVTQNTQFVGKDITYSEVLLATTDDPKATVEVKVTKPDGTEVTADSSAFEFTAPGYYTVTFTAKKGSYTEEPITVTGYVRDKNEAVSYEGVAGSDYLNTNDSTHGINTDLTYVKYGKQSLKATIAGNADKWVSSLKASLKVGKANQVIMWVYADKACTIGVGVQNGTTWITTAKTETTLVQGWNHVTIAFETTIAETESFAAFLIANKSDEDVTLYLDALSFGYDWQIFEKADVTKEVDPNGTLDLSTLYKLVDGEDVTVTAAADVGTVNGLQYTAPAEGGKYATVTFTATKGGESKTLVVKVFIKGGEVDIATWNMGVTEGFTLAQWAAIAGTDAMMVVEKADAKDGKAVQVTVAGGGGVNFGCGTNRADGATHVKLRIYSEAGGTVNLKIQKGEGDWAQLLGDNGTPLVIQAGWNEYEFAFSEAIAYSFNSVTFMGAGEQVSFYLDTVTFIKK